MSDIVERIRSLRFIHVPYASQLFEEAADEITRLRLTGEERDAVERAAAHLEGSGWSAATLRGLLDRTKCATH